MSDFSRPTYFECVALPGGTELRPVLAKTGAFELKRLRPVPADQ